MDIRINNYALLRASKINIILGKNGCGKSTLLKGVESGFAGTFGNVKYITPERGGALVYDSGIDQQLHNNIAWLGSSRRANQQNQFRQQTIAQYRSLETNVLRALEASVKAGNQEHPPLFDETLTRINNLLDNIQIQSDPAGGPIFKIISKASGGIIDALSISSGESELISLAIECLAFASSLVKGKENILFLDEPDVHLHPDLQGKLMQFLIELVEEHDFRVVIATHSTPLLGGLSGYDKAVLALMKPGDRELQFEPITEQYKQILPVFGAHPLSSVFNKTPILLLEGEDDVRIWQQAVRSSRGRISVYPVQCQTINKLNEYEVKVVRIVEAIYENPIAYSLRDRDGAEESIDDMLPVVRMRLSCRAAENLILCDEVLESTGVSWADFKSRSEKWLSDNAEHPQYEAFSRFKKGGYRRKTADLKRLRVLIVGAILGSDKPWEVLVGQVLANQKRSQSPVSHSMQDYLGEKLISRILPA